MTDPTDAPLGTLSTTGASGTVRFDVVVPADPAEVWAALTEPERLADWLGRVSGDLRPGGAFTAFFRVSEWDGVGLVERCDAGRGFTVLMHEHDEPAEDSTEVELDPADAGTRLVMTQRGHPVEQLAAYGAGLQVHVEDLLAHLEGRAGRHTADRFGELWPAYQALPVEGA